MIFIARWIAEIKLKKEGKVSVSPKGHAAYAFGRVRGRRNI